MIKLHTFNPHIGLVHLVRGAKAGAMSGVIYGAVNTPIINIGINLINGQLENFVADIMTYGLWLVGSTLMNSILGAILGMIFGLLFVVLYDRLPGITSIDKGVVTSIIHWALIPLSLSVLSYPEGLSMFFRIPRNWRIILIGLGTSILWGWLLGHFWERERPDPRPRKIKPRVFSSVKVTVIAFSIILISLNIAQSWGLLFPCPESQPSPFTSESMETLTITTDTTLTKDYINTTIVIAADNITLDGNGYRIIGPGLNYFIYDPEIEAVSVTIGIILEGRNSVTVTNCRVTGFGYGFFLSNSYGNTLQGNIANYNAFGGFVLASSSDNILRDNTANGSGDDPPNGFELGRSSENTFQGNTVNDNLNGFALEESEGNIFRGNTVNNNTLSGFMLGDSGNNTLTGNTISNNTNGIWWGHNNRIHHNNFVNNLQHVTIENTVNTWYDGYPSGGNYWSDYTGIDADGDGLGDTPYVINHNNMDHFPLMTPMSIDT